MRVLVAALLLATVTSACGDGGDAGSTARTTTTAAGRFPAVATGSADVASAAFTGTVTMIQDPVNPSEASPSEGTIRVQLIDPSSPPETRRTMSVGGAVRVGSPRPTSSLLIASYIGDGVILTSTQGECTVTVDRLDGGGATGRLECVDVAAGPEPLTVRATFELEPAPLTIPTSNPTETLEHAPVPPDDEAAPVVGTSTSVP